jgi:GT2 family glycosyltransferase
MALCSIIIPVFNKSTLTRQCLSAILANPPAADFEILVVDNGSSDGTAALLASYGNRIRPIVNERNLFFARACNQGAEQARGDLLIFLNNDTVPKAGWLDALVRYRQVHPRAGLIGAKLLFPNNTIQHAGMAICYDQMPRHIYLGFPANHPAVCKSRALQAVTGACILIERDLFSRAGMFDTAYVNSFEDMELCMRIGELGFEVHFCHDCMLYHLEGVSEGRHSFDGQNYRIFNERWRSRLRPDELEIYIADGLVRIEYSATTTSFRVAPELGVAFESGRELPVHRLLTHRAKQVNDLMRENVMLRAAASALPPAIALPAS